MNVCLAMVMVVLSAIPSAAADVVIKRDGSIVFGRQLHQVNSTVLLQERFEAGKYIDRRFDEREVLETFVTIDEQQLSRLSPDDPMRYVVVAEGLALVRIDPESTS